MGPPPRGGVAASAAMGVAGVGGECVCARVRAREVRVCLCVCKGAGAGGAALRGEGEGGCTPLSPPAPPPQLPTGDPTARVPLPRGDGGCDCTLRLARSWLGLQEVAELEWGRAVSPLLLLSLGSGREMGAPWLSPGLVSSPRSLESRLHQLPGPCTGSLAAEGSAPHPLCRGGGSRVGARRGGGGSGLQLRYDSGRRALWRVRAPRCPPGHTEMPFCFFFVFCFVLFFSSSPP